MRVVEQTEAFEVVVGGTGECPILLTCEHASNRLPEPWSWPDADRWLVDDHWAWDPGAAEVTRALAEELGACAVLSRYTRLLCDPNRAEASPDLFRAVADGRPVALNAAVTDAEARLAAYHRPYHAAVDRMAVAHPGRLVFSVHTFTPVYEGQRREVEVAVLFDEDEDLGIDLGVYLADQGLRTWLNEPWSGKAGLIYSPARAARASGRAALEIELRNDLATDAAFRADAIPRIAAALRTLLEPVRQEDELP